MVKLVKQLCFDHESARLLEYLAKKLNKSQSAVIRELIYEKAEELGIETEKPELAQI